MKELKRANDQTESLTKEEHMAREMMLPRGHHKNIIKVNISSADDEEDIQAKMDQARKQNYLHGMHNKNKEEKMDVEEPIPSKPPIPLIARKADNVPLQFD